MASQEQAVTHDATPTGWHSNVI